MSTKNMSIKNILLAILFLLVLPIAIWYAISNFYVQQNNIFLPLRTDYSKTITVNNVSWQHYSNDNINIETIRNGVISKKDQPVSLKGVTKDNESIKVSFYGTPKIEKNHSMEIYVFSLGSNSGKAYYAYPSKKDYNRAFSQAEHKVSILKQETWEKAYNFLFITLFSLWLVAGIAYFVGLKSRQQDENVQSKRN